MAAETGIPTAEQKGLLEPKPKDNCSGLHQLQGCDQELEDQKGSSCNRFIFFPSPQRLCRSIGTGYTGQRHNCSFLMVGATALTTLHNMDLVLSCPSSSAGLQEMLLLLRRIEESNIKSGTAIRPECESYFWSLYQTVQSLPASSKLLWKLLNTRDEDSSALDVPLDSYQLFHRGHSGQRPAPTAVLGG